jgi:hypothetical protein
MLGFGRQKTIKPKKKITGKPIKGLTPIAPDEFFDGLDPSKRVYTQGGMMGQNIVLERFFDPQVYGNICGRVSGFWTPKPREGDYLKAKMRSGNIAVFQFANVSDGWTADRKNNPFGPRDYFEADILYLGYEQDLGRFNRDSFKFSD